jgi:hypothetical protein
VTRQLPAAARAVIVAALIDAGEDGPRAVVLAELAAAELVERGWTCQPYTTPAAQQQAA